MNETPLPAKAGSTRSSSCVSGRRKHLTATGSVA
jgi:hypothetical protein